MRLPDLMAKWPQNNLVYTSFSAGAMGWYDCLRKEHTR